MNTEKVLKIASIACTAIGAAASIGSALISKKQSDMELEKLVTEKIAKIGK